MPTHPEKIDSILKQFNGLSFQSKQLVFLIMLSDLRTNLPRGHPVRRVLNDVAGLTPGNRDVFKSRLANKRHAQNTAPIKRTPVKKSPSKPRSPPTPLSGSRRKSPNAVPGAVNMVNLPKWYYGPHYANKRRI